MPLDELKEEIKEEKKIEEVKEEFVSKKAYGEVSSDMHRYKAELKDTKAMLSQLRADADSAKNEKLAEEGKWEDLYKNQSTKMEKLEAERTKEQNDVVNFHKKNSVLNSIGGFKNDEYNTFIKSDNINVNEDGSLDRVSLDAEIDRIRQTYPELLKSGTSQKLPNNAPIESNIGEKGYSDLSQDEKEAYKRKLINKPKGY